MTLIILQLGFTVVMITIVMTIIIIFTDHDLDHIPAWVQLTQAVGTTSSRLGNGQTPMSTITTGFHHDLFMKTMTMT